MRRSKKILKFVLLAVLVSYATTYMTSMGRQASSVEMELITYRI